MATSSMLRNVSFLTRKQLIKLLSVLEIADQEKKLDALATKSAHEMTPEMLTNLFEKGGNRTT